ncbi:Hypothetical protein FKW44_013865 [Caligus rogercresseyi]|uniref:Uncharacterized protein n=1 Tax=Caligus rogercresseyi TaxID=217165 RepID=A0A7T8GYU2_CALRO|nr:Hypothetical protein FKW44_013865 [Caligus rogercresseyi]
MTSDYPQGYCIKLHYNLQDTEGNLLKTPLSLAGPGGKGKGRARQGAWSTSTTIPS